MQFQIINNSVTATEFKLLFTPTERVECRELAKTDPFVADMFALLDDLRTTAVSLVMPQISTMLDYLITKGILTQERKDSILSGTLPTTEASVINTETDTTEDSTVTTEDSTVTTEDSADTTEDNTI